MTEQEWLSSSDPAAMLQRLTHERVHAAGAGTTEVLREPQPSDRKLRLFACACCRQVWDKLSDPRSQTSVEVAERYADGQATEAERKFARSEAWIVSGWLNSIGGKELLSKPVDVERVLAITTRDGGLLPSVQSALFRCLFGNPFRPVTVGVFTGGRTLPFRIDAAINRLKSWLRWHDRTIPRLAQAIYDSRDFDRMPILADALEEAGCTNEEILMHCRGQEQCGQCKGTGSWMPMKFELRGPVSCNKCLKGWRKTDAPHARGCWVLDLVLGKG